MNTRLGVALALVVVLLLGVSGLVHAHSSLPKSFDDLVSEAEQIFVGTIVDTNSFMASSGQIFTNVRFTPTETLKGDVPPAFTMTFLGGEAGGLHLHIAGWPQLSVGDTYVVFSKGNGQVIFPVVGVEQGLFRVARDPETGETIVRNAHGREITSPTVRSATRGTRAARAAATSRPTLDSLLEAVRMKLAQAP